MRPQVVAHRGASHDQPEHTLGAYLAALGQGAEALECDVRLTADGHLVCVHDRDLRFTGQSRGVVSTMDLAELERLDFASWKNPWAELDDEAVDFDPETGGVLTLEKLCQTVATYERPVQLAIETKHPTRYGGLVERRLVELLREFGWTDADSPARVMSFSHSALQRVERMAPDLPLVQLVERAEVWPFLSKIVAPEWIVGPGLAEMRKHPRFAERIGRSRNPVHVWTVNTADDLERCLELGVRAVITDRPAHLLELLDERMPASGVGRPGQ